MDCLVFAQTIVDVYSPDTRIRIEIDLISRPGSVDSKQHLAYSVIYDNKPLLEYSQIELNFKDQPAMNSNLELNDKSYRQIHETWERTWDKSKLVSNHCWERTIALREKTGMKREVEFIFRAYNDGIAFRYHLPKQKAFDEFSLVSEKTQFIFADNHVCWATKWNRTKFNQEMNFEKVRINDLKSEKVIGTPLLVHADNNLWAALLEANLTDWAGMFLAPEKSVPNAMVTKQARHPKDKSIIVKSKAPRYSPWRVIMIGQTPGDLVESNLIHNLNEPCTIEDTSWIKPGRCAWDWWWCGKYAPDVDFKLGPNNAIIKYFIDFASEMDWEYQLVD